MAAHRVLLDAFAEARRTWDELISLQPDILAAGDNLTAAQLIELEHRADTHRSAVEVLTDTLETEPREP